MRAGGQAVDVAIIGAGPAGLTAGYLLTKAGYSVAIIEKDPRYVGGISRTVEHEGYRFDIGGHRVVSRSRQVTDLLNEILPNDVAARPRMSRIYHEGKFYSSPLRPVEAVRNLGMIRSALCLASFAKARLFPKHRVRSFEDWAINAVGRTFYATFLKSYIEKMWGMSCSEMSADLAAQWTGGLSPWGAVSGGLKRSLGLNRRGGDGVRSTAWPDGVGASPRGPGTMWEAARDRIVERGGAVLMGHALKQLTFNAATRRWAVSASDGAGVVAIKAAHVISSAPMRELAGRLHPLPATLPEAAQLKYRDVLTVALTIRAAEPFPDDLMYVLDPKVKVARIRNFRSCSPETVPDPALACVGLEYFCSEGDWLWSSSDRDLVALATREMAVLGLCDAAQVQGGIVVRQEKAHSVYDKECATHVDMLRRELEGRYPTLHLVGRTGMHRDDDQDHAMRTAMLTVRNIAAGARVCDIWAVDDHDSRDVAQHRARARSAGAQAALARVHHMPERRRAA